jgi:hypothetical protein
MGSRTKALMIAGLLLFFAVDNYHMWIEEDNFPFCSHGLFNTLFQARTKLLRFVVHDSEGHIVVVDSGRVIPIEWYRAVGLAENVFVLESDTRRKEQLAQLLLDRLNRDGWPAFDESYAAIRPPRGATFVGLEVVHLEYDLRQYRYGEPLRPIGVERRFAYGTTTTARAR